MVQHSQIIETKVLSDTGWILYLYCILLSLFTETVVKTVRREHDVTRICNKESQTTIVLIICKINTQRDTGGECHLLYRHGETFTQECDARFSIIKENQTAFLELTSLTPADNGNYTCECTNTEGTYIVHISVTVEGKCIFSFCYLTQLFSTVLALYWPAYVFFIHVICSFLFFLFSLTAA